ncbi:MAG: hypothetical protein IPL49_09995 [Saprospirales bacterium]|nr:hypothetical protein [Saprospirales bacterium]MBK8491196.1 hypothetical protein [Saprospirales bacterium]
MNPIWKPLSAFFMTLCVQVIAPSDPAHRLVGVDFGEPTRDCAGRGQICRIEEVEWGGKWQPEAFGEAWMDSTNSFHFTLWAIFWDESMDSTAEVCYLPTALFLPFLPAEKRNAAPEHISGIREKNKIYFEWKGQGEK